MRYVTIVFLVLAVLGSTYGQSGRVKQSTKKATVAPVPVEPPEPSESEKPKKPSLPKMVDGERIYVGREVDESAIILKKPPPASTREARRHSFHGKMVLHAILNANGQVTNITIVDGLPYGLNEKAIEAARLIKFRPAVLDGKQVSQWVRIEYEFWFV